MSDTRTSDTRTSDTRTSDDRMSDDRAADYDPQPGRETPPETEPSAEQLEVDAMHLTQGLAGVAGIVAGASGVRELLAEVAEFAAQAIPGVDGAGVVLVGDDDYVPHAQAWAGSADFIREIDLIQYKDLNEGPCVTCMHSQRPTVSGSLGCDPRWPRFGGHVARMGVHSALSLPLIVGDRVIGAINAYAKKRDAFTEYAVRLGSQFAGPAAVSVYNAQLLATAQAHTERLQRALSSRAIIDQAIGIVRSRSGGSATEAFVRLTRMSQADNVKLSVVAEHLVEEAVRRARSRGVVG